MRKQRLSGKGDSVRKSARSKSTRETEDGMDHKHQYFNGAAFQSSVDGDGG